MTEVAEQLKIEAMDAATKAKHQKYLDKQLFTESALESAYDKGYFNGEKKERQKRILKLASMEILLDTITAAFSMSVAEVRVILEQRD